MATMKDLLRKIHPYGPGPADDGCHVRVEMKSGFEPNGRASESWEHYCVLTLPGHLSHWRNTHGEFVRTKVDTPFSVKRRTMEECIDYAHLFMTSARVSSEEHDQRIKEGYYRG